tara:strand:+ start:622 stop:1251 length:630 start_codon:yes stop_codon:yes gene_type:complete
MFDKIVQIESLITAIVTLVITLLTIYVKNKAVKAQKEKNQECPEIKAQKQMEALTQKNEQIIDCIEYTRSELNADRCYIFEFSNGVHFSSGMPAQKFTCSYECVNGGISSECQNPGEYRVSNYNSFIKKIINGDSICFNSLDECKMPLFRELLAKKGVKSVYNFPIKNLQGKVVGIFGVDYVKRERKLEGKHLEILKNRALKLGGYLVD